MSGMELDKSMLLPLVTTVAVVLFTGVVGVCLGRKWLVNKASLESKHPKTLNGMNLPLKCDAVMLKLIEKEELTHDTRRFRFALPSEKHVLGLPVGQHLSLKFQDAQDRLVSRAYTPITSDDEVGYVDLVVKIYFKNVHPKFPEGGKMSQYLNDMKIGDCIEVAGPKGKMTYQGQGLLHIRHRPRDSEVDIRRAKHIGMIAGGTGITPMLQIVRQALKDSKDTTRFSILFANQTEDDILCRKELEDMAALPQKTVSVWYTVDRPPSSKEWPYSSGFVNAEMIQEHLPPPGPDTQIFLCGPPPMIKFAILPALEQLGYSEDMYFSF